MISEQANRFFSDLRKRYSPADIKGFLDRIEGMRVLVIGEAIIDEYAYCEGLGKSGKESMLVVRYVSTERFAGGTLAIANHLAGLGCSVELVTYLGEENTEEDFVISSLSTGVRTSFIYKSHSPTIVKRRFLDGYSLAKLLGVYDINDEELSQDEEMELCSILANKVPSCDLIVVADYDHGLITHAAMEFLISSEVFLAVNTQVNAANIGFHTVSKYTNADYVCIQEGEIRMDRRSRTGDLECLVKSVFDEMSCGSIMVTRGSYGSLLYSSRDGFIACPAFATNVVDRVGAGDTVLSMTSPLSAMGAPGEIVAFLANVAGAEAVCSVGNKKALMATAVRERVDTLLVQD